MQPEIAGAKQRWVRLGYRYAIDCDHDGWVDIVETNGWPPPTEWLGENSYMFRNNGDLTFTEVQGGSLGVQIT